MTRFEWALLIVGAVVFTITGILVALRRRRFSRGTWAANPGLLPQELNRSLPDGVTAGMVGALLNSRVDLGDVMIEVVELAVKGHVSLRPLIDERLRDDADPYDWLLRIVDDIPYILPDAQKTLLTIPFGNGRKTGTQARPTTTLSAMVTDSHHPVSTARSQLKHAASAKGWLSSEGASEFRNGWGCAGGAVLLIGLVGTVIMIISGLATAALQGIIGAMLIAISGAMIASLGPLESHQSTRGMAIGEETLSHREFLRRLEASDINPASAPEDFSRWLPAALAFNLSAHLGEVFDVATERAAKWGRTLDVTPKWLIVQKSGTGSPPPKPSEVVSFVSDFITLGARMAHAERQRG